MKRAVVWRMAVAAAVAVGLHSAAALAQAPQAAGDAAVGWRAVAQCAEIGAAERRHACVDDVLRRAGLLQPEREARARRENFGRDAEPKSARTEPRVAQQTPPPASSPASSPAPSVRTAAVQSPSPGPPVDVRAPPEPGNPDRLRTTVGSSRIGGNRLLVVVTADGAVWEQTEHEEFHVLPQPGDTFEIQRGGLGGYRCTFGRSSIYRCRRLD